MTKASLLKTKKRTKLKLVKPARSTRASKAKPFMKHRALLVKILVVTACLALLQFIFGGDKAFAATKKSGGTKVVGGPSKKSSNSIIKGANANLRGSRALYCTSHSSAPAYLGQSGRWTLQGEVVSEYTLKGVTLKNASRKDLGSISDRISRDQRIAEERVFKLQPDVFCDYEINLPRDFSGEKTFRARLVETCDNLFDGTAELNCHVRD